MADTTDYSMEISRLGVVTNNADPQMEISETYYMTKENRIFNIYIDNIKKSTVLRFRGANSTNIGSVTMRGSIITTWEDAN